MMRSTFSPGRLLSAALLALLAAPLPASAHAILMQSQPAIRATVVGPDIAVDLRFNSRIDHKRSRLILIREDKSQEVLPIADGGEEDEIKATAKLTPGTYTVRWQVLAIDGHITRGDVPFTVGQ